MRTTRFISALAMALALAGCATPTVAPEALKAQVAEASGLPAQSIAAVDTVRFGVAKKAWAYADFQQGVYAQTASQVLLLKRTKSGALQSFRAIPLAQIQSAGVGSRGAFNHLKQLHLTLPEGVMAVLFSNHPDAEAGYEDRTEAARKSLESAGVKVPPIDAWVFTQESRDFVVPILSGK